MAAEEINIIVQDSNENVTVTVNENTEAVTVVINDFSTSNIISNDAGNAVILGTDGGIFVPENGGGVSKHSELDLDDGTNPHGTTKSDVGLSNVDNTSDIDKPVSNAQYAADLAILNSANAYSDNKIVQTVTNGDTEHAASSDVVFDKLLLKLDKSGYSNASLPLSSADKLLINQGGDWKEVEVSEIGGSSQTILSIKGGSSDFLSNNALQGPFQGAAINAGSLDSSVFTSTTKDGYIGNVAMRSGTSANGGYRFMTNSSTAGSGGGMRVQAGLTFFGIIAMETATAGTDRIVRMGFHNYITEATPAANHGCFFQVSGDTAQIITRNSGTDEGSSTFTVSNSSSTDQLYYLVKITFTSATTVDFKVKDDAGTVLLSGTHSTQVPPNSVRFGAGIVSIVPTAGSNRFINYIDYMGVFNEEPEFLKDF